MLPGFRAPVLIPFHEIVVGETLAYVETILRSERSSAFSTEDDPRFSNQLDTGERWRESFGK